MAGLSASQSLGLIRQRSAVGEKRSFTQEPDDLWSSVTASTTEPDIHEIGGYVRDADFADFDFIHAEVRLCLVNYVGNIV